MTIEQFNKQNGTVLVGAVQQTDTGIKEYNIAILFDYIEDETSAVEADITDNWVESNYTLQDHIAIKPRVYRLKGCVGEVLYENISLVEQFFEDFKSNHPVFQKTMGVLDKVSVLSGTVGNATRSVLNIIKQIESSVDRYYQMTNKFLNTQYYRGKRQKIVYEVLQQMLRNRVPVKLKDLAYNDTGQISANDYNRLYFIQSVSAHQGNNAFISDIEVTVKEFRIATTKTTKVDKNKFGGYASTQKTETAQNGSANTQEVEKDPFLDKPVPGTAVTPNQLKTAAMKVIPPAWRDTAIGIAKKGANLISPLFKGR